MYFLESDLKKYQLEFIFAEVGKLWDKYLDRRCPFIHASCEAKDFIILGTSQNIDWWHNGNTTLDEIFNVQRNKENSKILQDIYYKAKTLEDPDKTK
ncbi:MAG: hypothetical protein KGO96_07175 [Elusimicrobia bacterium]|nr:hypothetical protein [Elusimicrobiota bacterium]